MTEQTTQDLDVPALVRQAVATVASVSVDQLSDDTDLENELDVDSLDLAEIAGIMHGHGIEVDKADLKTTATVGELVGNISESAAEAAK